MYVIYVDKINRNIKVNNKQDACNENSKLSKMNKQKQNAISYDSYSMT
jgi:hypothetical protein